MLTYAHAAMLLLFISSSALGATSSTLCMKNEQIFFSCRIGEKTVSVCASNPVTDQSGYVQYRFGNKDDIELTYPASLLPPYNHFFHHTGTYSGGYMAHLSFKNGKYDYVVYDHFLSVFDKAGRRGHEQTSGVIVIDNRGKETNLRCSDAKNAKLQYDEHLFQDDDFYPYK